MKSWSTRYIETYIDLVCKYHNIKLAVLTFFVPKNTPLYVILGIGQFASGNIRPGPGSPELVHEGHYRDGFPKDISAMYHAILPDEKLFSRTTNLQVANLSVVQDPVATSSTRR